MRDHYILKKQWGTTVAYKESLTLDYQRLGSSIVTVEKEWKTIKDAIVGIADELCGKTSVKQNNTLDGRKNLEGNWRKERDMEGDRSENGQEKDTTLHQLYG